MKTIGRLNIVNSWFRYNTLSVTGPHEFNAEKPPNMLGHGKDEFGLRAIIYNSKEPFLRSLSASW